MYACMLGCMHTGVQVCIYVCINVPSNHPPHALASFRASFLPALLCPGHHNQSTTRTYVSLWLLCYHNLCVIITTMLLPPFQYSRPWSSGNAIFSRKIDKAMRNRFLWGQGFPTISGLPSLDNVALTDFCIAKFDVGWQIDQNQAVSLDHVCSAYGISGLTSLRWPQLGVISSLGTNLGCIYNRISQGIGKELFVQLICHNSNI